MNKKLVIWSGGLDSTTVLYEVLQQRETDSVVALHFLYGSKHTQKENEAIQLILGDITTKQICPINVIYINLEFINEYFKSDLLQSGGKIPIGHYEDSNMKKTVVPFRNGIMLTIACGYANSHGIKDVYIGTHQGDHTIYPDCRELFIKKINEAVNEGIYGDINIEAPFINKKKSSIVSAGNLFGVPFEHVWTCYKGEDIHCGVCGACVERREAFKIAHVPDPTSYLH